MPQVSWRSSITGLEGTLETLGPRSLLPPPLRPAKWEEEEELATARSRERARGARQSVTLKVGAMLQHLDGPIFSFFHFGESSWVVISHKIPL